MKEYQLECSKYHGWVKINKDGIILDVIYVFEKFKGQHISNLTNWITKKFNYCIIKEINHE